MLSGSMHQTNLYNGILLIHVFITRFQWIYYFSRDSHFTLLPSFKITDEARRWRLLHFRVMSFSSSITLTWYFASLSSYINPLGKPFFFCFQEKKERMSSFTTFYVSQNTFEDIFLREYLSFYWLKKILYHFIPFNIHRYILAKTLAKTSSS